MMTIALAAALLIAIDIAVWAAVWRARRPAQGVVGFERSMAMVDANVVVIGVNIVLTVLGMAAKLLR